MPACCTFCSTPGFAVYAHLYHYPRKFRGHFYIGAEGVPKVKDGMKVNNLSLCRSSKVAGRSNHPLRSALGKGKPDLDATLI